MSPERAKSALFVELRAAPSAARIASDDSLDAWIARRIEFAHAAGVERGERRVRENSALALDTACERLDAAREQAAEQLAATTAQLAVEIARQLLRTEIAAGRYDLERIVRETLAFADVGRGRCVVHVNPLDAAELAVARFRSGTTIEADEAVARGDVHVTTPGGLLVREIDAALRDIGERLRGDLA